MVVFLAFTCMRGHSVCFGRLDVVGTALLGIHHLGWMVFRRPFLVALHSFG